jgi:hypothetical protein
MTAGRIRGRSLIPVRAFVKETFGEHGWKRFLAELAPAHRALLDGLIVPDAWYDRTIDTDQIAALAKLWAQEMPDLWRKLGARVARHHVRSYLRPLMVLGGPILVIKRAASLYREYYQGGAMAVVERRDTGARLSLEDPLQHRWFCGHSLPGFIEEFIALAGRQVVHVRQDVCTWNGAEHCELDLEWR